MKEILIDSLENIEIAAKEFLMQKGDSSVIAFYGGMGAGKTTFCKAICNVLGVEDNVGSPTFTLVNEYAAEDGSPIFHFDFYRLDKPEEAFDIGVEEYFYSGELCLIEWPEKIEQILPDECLKVQISVLDNGFRKLVF